MKTSIILFVIVMATLGWLMLTHAAAQDEQLTRVSGCVAQKAAADGFTKNPYGRDAWIEYASGCSQ